ncbi:MAG: molecular chaperone DnaJ [Pseudomonadota bacterium]
MIQKDLYDILGVKPDAGAEVIKTAYRKLARKYHPDVNPGDKTAEARFKEITEAYDILSRPEKKAEYDRLRTAASESHHTYTYPGGERAYDFGGFAQEHGGDSFSSIFEDLFGERAFRARQPARGSDLHTVLNVDFREAVFGTERQMTLSEEDVCPNCAGNGTEPSQGQVCSECRGTGQKVATRGTIRVAQTCDRCGGTGRTGTRACPACRGAGTVRTEKRLNVKIPAGVDDGSRIRLAGGGAPGPAGGPHGDLYIDIQVRPDPVFKREGNDIHARTIIDIYTAVLGGKATVDTLHGAVEMKIKPGTQNGQKFRLKGKGVPVPGGKKGDQIVDVQVIIPKDLDRRSKELFKELKEIGAG